VTDQLVIAAEDLRALRGHVRERLQHELATLMCIDRPRLRALLEADDEPLDLGRRRELELQLEAVNNRIGAVRTYLGTVPVPGPSVAVRTDSAVLLDRGDGPRLILLITLPVPTFEDVVPVDSPLGAALLGSAAGATIRYRTPHGEARAQVLAVQS
jgi:transcription elongation GreA/GreB family factor